MMLPRCPGCVELCRLGGSMRCIKMPCRSLQVCVADLGREGKFTVMQLEIGRSDAMNWTAGSLFWILESRSHPDYDSYSIYTSSSSYPHNPQKPVPLPPAMPACAASGQVQVLPLPYSLLTPINLGHGCLCRNMILR